MHITRDDIIHGLTTYVNNDVIEVISNNNLRFILSAATAAVSVNPKLAEGFFENPMIKSAIQVDDDCYDIDYAEQILTKTIKEVGELRIEVPSVPFVLPHSQELIFHSKDVENLFKAIREEANLDYE